jgi:hypothetical protein
MRGTSAAEAKDARRTSKKGKKRHVTAPSFYESSKTLSTRSLLPCRAVIFTGTLPSCKAIVQIRSPSRQAENMKGTDPIGRWHVELFPQLCILQLDLLYSLLQGRQMSRPPCPERSLDLSRPRGRKVVVPLPASLLRSGRSG